MFKTQQMYLLGYELESQIITFYVKYDMVLLKKMMGSLIVGMIMVVAHPLFSVKKEMVHNERVGGRCQETKIYQLETSKFISRDKCENLTFNIMTLATAEERNFFISIRIFIVEDKVIQNCINLKTKNLHISKNNFEANSTNIGAMIHRLCNITH